jgi:YidC/Oxa1 family membrane protein insertase
MQQKNFLLFLALFFLLFAAWAEIGRRIWPPPPKPDLNEEELTEGKPVPKPDPAKKGGDKKTEGDKKKDGDKKPDKTVAAAGKLRLPAPTPDNEILSLGSADPTSAYHLLVRLDPRGAGIRQVVLNKFQQADDMGRPVWIDKANKVYQPLELVPEAANTRFPSFLFFHFGDVDQERPLDTLGREKWQVVREEGQKSDVREEELPDGRTRLSVAFRAEVQGVEITKTYTLTEKEYHLGLTVKLRRKEGTKDSKFRYQMTGAHGLPIEGKWYTSTFRNAVTLRVDRNDNVWRHLQELREIAVREGGDVVGRDDAWQIRYAGVAVQYFASLVVVDENQKRQDFLEKTRPTLEYAVAKGTVKSIDKASKTFVVTLADKDKTEQLFHFDPLHPDAMADALSEGAHVAVTFYTDSITVAGDGRDQAVLVATAIGDEHQTQPLFNDDVTVRVTTEAFDLKPGEEVVHKYLLYNGPVKPALLGSLSGHPQVSQELVDRYTEKLHLNTLTDYQSSGPLGSFANKIYWTSLLIKCTNLMHWVLGHINSVIPNYGVCIILLTVLVRGLMFPVSRKQALTSIKMQQLAPELKKLHAKFKDDRQAMGTAQMELYRKHGVNPFATCWFLLLQMPIFMGLYFALQESISFRLASFWPTWITNLAAPDMLWEWGQGIPWISRPEDYGGWLYLGPYLNLLPIVAVALMIVQQKMMTPPPADEQQEMQQKMMKYMMIVMGIIFYKMAAGLCVYFIASSLWGFAERRLLPKTKPVVGDVTAEGALQKLLARGEGVPAAPAGAVTTDANRARKPGRNKRKERGARDSEPAADGSGPLGRLRAWWRVRRERLRAWWAEVLKQAEKK